MVENYKGIKRVDKSAIHITPLSFSNISNNSAIKPERVEKLERTEKSEKTIKSAFSPGRIAQYVPREGEVIPIIEKEILRKEEKVDVRQVQFEDEEDPAHIIITPPAHKEEKKDKKEKILEKEKKAIPEEKPEVPSPAVSSPAEQEHILLAEHLAEMNEIFKINNELLSELAGYIAKSTGMAPEEKYYSTEQIAITVDTPIKPTSSDAIADPNTIPPTPGYDRIQVYDQMNRKSRNISVINDGTTHLFVRTSADGKKFSTQENPIFVGESRIFHNIYEMRIRSPSSGNLVTGLGGVYRVTEYDYSLSYSSTVLSGSVNRPSFVTRVVNAPLGGFQLPNIPVANGFALTLRANVNNGLGFVFIADTIANVTNAAIPGFRNTLAAGDTLRVFLTNANLVFIAGSTGAENLDIIVET